MAEHEVDLPVDSPFAGVRGDPARRVECLPLIWELVAERRKDLLLPPLLDSPARSSRGYMIATNPSYPLVADGASRDVCVHAGRVSPKASGVSFGDRLPYSLAPVRPAKSSTPRIWIRAGRRAPSRPRMAMYGSSSLSTNRSAARGCKIPAHPRSSSAQAAARRTHRKRSSSAPTRGRSDPSCSRDPSARAASARTEGSGSPIAAHNGCNARSGSGRNCASPSAAAVSDVPERIAQATNQRADRASISHPCQRLDRHQACIGVTTGDGARERAQRNIGVKLVGVESPVGKLQTPGRVLAHQQDHDPLRLLHAGAHGGRPEPDDAVDGPSPKSHLRPSS